MSVQIMSRVWEKSTRKGNDLLLLLAISDHTDSDGVCWPGIESLAEKTRVTERQLIRNVHTLAESGELFIKTGGGRSNTNLYMVTVGLSAAEIQPVLVKRFKYSTEQAANITADILSKQAKNTVIDDSVTEAETLSSETETLSSKAETLTSKALNPVTDDTRIIINHHVNLNTSAEGNGESPFLAKNISPPDLPLEITPPKNGTVGPKTRVKDKFLELTGFDMPANERDKKFWWSQIGEILKICHTPDNAGMVMTGVVEYMTKENLTITTPKSLVGLCRLSVKEKLPPGGQKNGYYSAAQSKNGSQAGRAAAQAEHERAIDAQLARLRASPHGGGA